MGSRLQMTTVLEPLVWLFIGRSYNFLDNEYFIESIFWKKIANEYFIESIFWKKWLMNILLNRYFKKSYYNSF